ncbi:hypothetical protein [Staphylococcus borealis]|uniref:hypothetical protein n=2 Tax=Staphylococcus borealis TaxID=2742203 RepID=UPI00374F11F1
MKKIKDNDALKEQIITLKAKLGIVSLNFLCAIAIFAMFNDLQREYLSPIFIGSICLLIVIVCKLTIHSETVDDIHIYVNDFSDKTKLNHYAKLKRIIYLIVWILYIIVVANIVTPNLNHTSHYEWVFKPSWLVIGVGVIVALCMFDDKRIKYTDMNTPKLENRGATPRGILNLIPNYRYADEQQKNYHIINVHATNFNWIMIGLSIVSVIDVIIEFAMHQFPLVAIIALIYSVILLLIVKVKTKHLCKLHDE